MRARALIALLAAMALTAATGPAHAQVKSIGGLARDLPTGAHGPRAVVARAANLGYGGGSVLHWNRTHLIFWQPSESGLTFEPGYQSLIETFLQRVAADSHKPNNVYGLSGQYTDQFGPAVYDSRYAGAVVDRDRLPRNGCVEPTSTGPPGWTTCLTDGQLENEIERVVAANHLPRGATDVYILVTPNRFGDCIDSSSTSCALGGSGTGYCGYHSQTFSGLLYAVIPYNAVAGHCQSSNPRPNRSAADPAISTISHEHNEIVTDPDADGWTDSAGNENGDLCITNFGPILGGSGQTAWNESIHGGHYYLQEEWSNDDHACEPRDEADPVSIASPAKTQARKQISFLARASDPDGSIASYTWYFGDGTIAHHRFVTHTFRRAGNYRVVVRTTDSAGNWAYAARNVHVLKLGARLSKPGTSARH